LTILIIVAEEYKLWSSSLCSFLQSPVTSSLFGPNILLNTLSLCSSLNVRHKVSHPYRTTGKIIEILLGITSPGFEINCSTGIGFLLSRHAIGEKRNKFGTSSLEEIGR
jgi:hypothetical protein